MSNYPRKIKHFLRIATPIYYWGMSLDTVKYQEMQSYSFDETSP